jgi:hypothetical protein
MTSTLIKLYATHVVEGKRTIESVPEKLREEVEKLVVAEKAESIINE